MNAADILQRIKDKLNAEMEIDPIPDVILNYAKQRQGKPINKRDRAALTAMYDNSIVFFLGKSAYSTTIKWWGQYSGKAAPNGVPYYDNARDIKISSETNYAKWNNPDLIKADNQWCYSARDERNAKRLKLLESLSPENNALTKVSQLVEALVMTRNELKAFFEDEGCDQSRYIVKDIIKDLCGEEIRFW